MCLKNCLIYNFGWNEKNISVENKINNMLTRVSFPVLYAFNMMLISIQSFSDVDIMLATWSLDSFIGFHIYLWTISNLFKAKYDVHYFELRKQD
jgi:hypothetical protein